MATSQTAIRNILSGGGVGEMSSSPSIACGELSLDSPGRKSVQSSAGGRYRILPRNIDLAQKLEAFAEENRGRAIGIVDMQGERGESPRMRKQWISKMDVHFRHEQGCEQFCQLGSDFAQLHYNHRTDAVSDVMLLKQLLYQLGIAHHNPGNGRIGRFRDAHGNDMGVVGVKKLHHFHHRADLVRQKNGELLDEGPVNL